MPFARVSVRLSGIAALSQEGCRHAAYHCLVTHRCATADATSLHYVLAVAAGAQLPNLHAYSAADPVWYRAPCGTVHAAEVLLVSPPQPGASYCISIDMLFIGGSACYSLHLRNEFSMTCMKFGTAVELLVLVCLQPPCG